MYDVIVVGGGHAGCEAALSSSKIGMKTLLVTGDLSMVASLPCNPSIGGPAKGILVREIDALGGYMAKNADKCQIQIKMLNSSKGPAVRALRAQADKVLYPREMLKHLEKQNNLTLLEALVDKLDIVDNKACGIYLMDGTKISSKTVILTTGTYLNSRILRGDVITISGPDNQQTTKGISEQLREVGFHVQRLKTGTPARIKKDSIDYSYSTKEPGDKEPWKFTYDESIKSIENVSIDCRLIYTNQAIHDLIRENLSKSAMYGGIVEGVGPRYCPSIEDKIVKFSDKERHQIFIEPESLYKDEVYIQGFSTSMPIEIQDKMLRLLPGFKDCVVARYAYAIEYDAIDPLQLWPSLETKVIKNLFCAGQINGTSGYEEAAAQGLIAGINAYALLNNIEPLVLKRDEAYLGVLIDDLVTKGASEPYRLLTSRAEYRLLLRHDNADLRLRDYGYKYKMISEEENVSFQLKKKNISTCIEKLNHIKIKPNNTNNEYLTSINTSPLLEGISYSVLFKRPEVNFTHIYELLNRNNQLEEFSFVENFNSLLEIIEIEIKYAGYIAKARTQADKMRSMDLKNIPDDIEYSNIKNIALEAREKLNRIRPKTIGQASRISGINPADIAVLIVYIEGMKKNGF